MKLNFCINCGGKIKSQDQKFCEFCGASIEQKNVNVEKESIKQISSPTTTNPSIKIGGLFDINRNFYVLKEKYWDWGGGDILDDKGQVIGKMKRRIFSIRKTIELRELDGSVAASIHEKLITARGAQDLKDSQGNLIARIKKKILSLLHPKLWLEDPNGNRWYEAQGKLFGWSYKVLDLSTNKIVAEIEKADRWRDVFLRGLFDFKDTYVLKILDNETDRRILVGFVISIDNILHDK